MHIVRPSLHAARSAALAALLALAAAGCSSDSGSVTGSGDAGGTRLVVFASDRGVATGQYDLYVWDADKIEFRDQRGLNTTFAERHPTISTDGRFIAFQSDRGLGTSDDIYMYDRYNAGFVSLPGLNTADAEAEPVFTGDGLRLAFAQGVTQRRIRLYDGQSKQLVPLPGLDTTGVAYGDWSPAPNRDGGLIAFVSDRNGTRDVFVYHRYQKRLLDLPQLRSGGNDEDPYLAPNGRFLVFSSDRGGSYDLYLMEFAVRDTTLTPLTATNTALSDERNPVMSESGNVVVFQSNRADGIGGWDIWNHDRLSGQVGQGPGYSGATADIEPSVRWPN